MPTFSFTLVIEGDATSEDNLDALFDAGCDDATFSQAPPISYGDFDRRARTLVDAVLSAIAQVEAVDELRVRRVASDDLVTPPEIAKRLGRTRQSIYQLINGDRGDGDFPAPVSTSGGKGKLWDWSEVAAWAGADTDLTRPALIAALNGALALRRARNEIGSKPLARLLDFAAA